MHEEVHARFQHHPLGEELVELDVEIDIGLGPFDEGAAHFLQPLDELPRDAADDQLALESEDAERGDVAGGRHAAEETVALDEGDFRPLARGGDGCDEAGRSAAGHDDVIVAGLGRHRFETSRGRGAGNKAGEGRLGAQSEGDDARDAVFQEEPSVDFRHMW